MCSLSNMTASSRFQWLTICAWRKYIHGQHKNQAVYKLWTVGSTTTHNEAMASAWSMLVSMVHTHIDNRCFSVPSDVSLSFASYHHLSWAWTMPSGTICSLSVTSGALTGFESAIAGATALQEINPVNRWTRETSRNYHPRSVNHSCMSWQCQPEPGHHLKIV